jgi:hypothetical protein
MTDAVKMRMAIPSQFAQFEKQVARFEKQVAQFEKQENSIREIWLASDCHVAIQ